MVTAEVSPPAGVTVATEGFAKLASMEGVAKGGYPVDITAQSTADLTNIGPSEICATTLIESGLEPGAVAQMDVGFTVLDAQEAYNNEQEFPSSITEVIRPMEMAELVDILPTLSLIEEETSSGPPTPSVMDVLESFGLGIDENNTLFDLGNSGLISGAGNLSQHNLHCNNSSGTEAHSENVASQEQDASAPRGVSRATGGDFPVRNQVEWDRPSHSSSWYRLN